MIDSFQIQRLAEKAGVPSEIIEKDYFIELLLCYLAKDSKFRKRLIFRGETALRKIYFSDYRFSEDLDFLVEQAENLDDYTKKMGKILDIINLEFPYNLRKRFNSESDRLQLFISYDIIPEIRAVKELKIDVLKDSYIPPTLNKPILFVYEAFLGEKAELRIYTLNKKIGHDIHYASLLSAIKNEDYRRYWEIRLTKQIKDLPHFEFVSKELERLIEKKLIGT